MSEVINEPVMDVEEEEQKGAALSLPLYSEEDVVEGFRLVFDEIVLLKAALAEILRELAELKAKQ